LRATPPSRHRRIVASDFLHTSLGVRAPDERLDRVTEREVGRAGAVYGGVTVTA
jgi:hypothetical protein